jgi:hypothetical protein
MKKDSDHRMGIRVAFALVLAFLPVACTSPPPQPSVTATSSATGEKPTSLPATPTTSPEPSPTSASPDVILHNASILTMEAGQPEAQAMAI